MTKRMKKRAKIIGKTSTMKEELLAAGYSQSVANHQPPSVTKAKGWLELLEQQLPDNDLLKVHKEGLQASKIVSSHTEPDYSVPDYQTRAKYLELGYKVKGRLKENTVAVQVNNPQEMSVMFE